MAASASKKASNTPAWLKRQKRFHTEFQCPNAAGRARHVMLWTQKECTASRKIRSFRPLAPRRERQARKTSSTVAQSSSVIRVSMVGSSQTDLPSVTDPRTWESTHRILSPIRPHGLGRVDGFDDDEAQSECDEGPEVLVRFLAAERNSLEALELADELLDAGAGAIERLREERWSVPGG